MLSYFRSISNKFSITTNSIENEFLKFQITQDGSLTIENKFFINVRIPDIIYSEITHP